jgi:DNA-binding transcriptional MerR regulator
MIDIPKKHFYKIGEVCQYTDTQPYVLRFWESEFPQLEPDKSRSGQRVYTRDDIDLVFKIKHLLYDQEFTIAGARKRIEEEATGGRKKKAAPGTPRAPEAEGEPSPGRLFTTPATEVKVRGAVTKPPRASKRGAAATRSAEKSHKEALREIRKLRKRLDVAENGWRESDDALEQLRKENEADRARRERVATKLERVVQAIEAIENGE